MKNYLPLLQSTSLFTGIPTDQLQVLLAQLGAVVRSYGKGEALVLAGEPNRRVGVVLTGTLEAYRPAPGWARIPITHMEPGGVFGDVLGGSSLASPVTVLAAAPCEVLLIPYERLLLSDGSPAHQRALQNLVRTISDKYFSLSRRIDLLVLKSLRAKVCAYLLSEAEAHHSLTFTIPYSRIQLADYLNCDRSALSRELSLMQSTYGRAAVAGVAAVLALTMWRTGALTFVTDHGSDLQALLPTVQVTLPEKQPPKLLPEKLGKPVTSRPGENIYTRVSSVLESLLNAAENIKS